MFGWQAAAVFLTIEMTKVPDLDRLRWQNRVVIIFAAQDGDEKLRAQDAIIEENLQGFAERDIKVFRVKGDGPEAVELRKKLGAEEKSFAVILVGKDGGVKLRRTEPISARDLFGTIDKMPMRKQEARERK